MYQYLLCINVRPQNVADFTKISARIARLAPEIGVLGRPGDYHESMIPSELVHLPRLTIYLVNPPAVPDSRGHILTVAQIDKYQQYLNYVKTGVKTPKTIEFRPGDCPDLAGFGDHLILKPCDESYGRGVYLLPKQTVNLLDKAVHKALGLKEDKKYLLQDFIRPPDGIVARYRALVFLGEVLLLYKATRLEELHFPETLSDTLRLKTFDSNQGYKRVLVRESDIEKFAVEMYRSHSDRPLQGLDICKESNSQHCYAIENNSGGNVWSFSHDSPLLRQAFTTEAMIRQFKAWVVSADALIRKTRELAC